MHSLSKGHSCNAIGDNSLKKRISIHRLLHAIALCGASIFTLPALADFVPGVSVSLIAPGGYTDGTTIYPDPISLVQGVDYGALNSITAANGGDIGSFMLPDEQISLSGESILIRAAQGEDALPGGTGFLGSGASHARYEFSGLSITGRTITGFTLYAFDGYGTTGLFSGVSSLPAVSLTLDTLVFNLDDFDFVDRLGGLALNYAEFRIDILSRADTQPPDPNGVPEPGSLMLASVALLALHFVSRRRAKNADNRKAGVNHA